MRSISVHKGDERLDLIEQNCHNLERVKLVGAPKMIILKNLKKISLCGVGILSRETFAEFISRNQQLESLTLRDTHSNLIEVLDGRLNSLKKLKYYFDARFDKNLPKIRLELLGNIETRFIAKSVFCSLTPDIGMQTVETIAI